MTSQVAVSECAFTDFRAPLMNMVPLGKIAEVEGCRLKEMYVKLHAEGLV